MISDLPPAQKNVLANLLGVLALGWTLIAIMLAYLETHGEGWKQFLTFFILFMAPLYAAFIKVKILDYLNRKRIDSTSSNNLFSALQSRAVGIYFSTGVIITAVAPFIILIWFLQK